MNQDHSESAFATEDEDTAALYAEAVAAAEDDEAFTPVEPEFAFEELEVPADADPEEEALEPMPVVVEEGLASDELALTAEDEWVFTEEPADLEEAVAGPALEPFIMPEDWDQHFDSLIASLPTVPEQPLWVQIQLEQGINIDSIMAKH